MKYLKLLCIPMLASISLAGTAQVPLPKEKLNPKQIQSAIEYRQSYFTLLGSNFYGVVEPMAIDLSVQMDKKLMRKAVSDMKAISSIDILGKGFGLNSIKLKKTKAKSEIWKNWKEFNSLYSDLVKNIGYLNDAVDTDKETLIREYAKKVQESCKNCHSKYLSK